MIIRKCYVVAIAVLMAAPLHTSASADRVKDYRVTNPDLETIRSRVIDDLVSPALDESMVSDLLKTIRNDGSWPGIDYQDVSRTGFQHATHLNNMFVLARAYKKPESPWFQSADVKKRALSALDFWLQHDFIGDNWWWNEMGTPLRMINTLLVLDSDLNPDQIREGLRIAGRANLEASGARPGGDLIQIAGMLGKQALFRRDETIFDRVIAIMADEIRITTGRGLKPDMSFHHRIDNVICTLSYGLGYANTFAYWGVKISGTRYRFPEESTELLIDYFLDGICKSMVHGRFPDPGAKNRDLSRKGTLNPMSPQLAENLMKISAYRKMELSQIAAIRRGETSPDLTWNRFFWHSEYFTHQRPGYFSSVRLHSSRNHTTEQPHNEEGLKMHHVGDGANFISVTGQEYLDIFPAWDWRKVPGTTVVQKPELPHWKEIAKQGLTEFVGGVSDGKFGAVAFDFRSAHDPLSARKAWFFFDNEYVCLGAGVTSTADHPVATTLNQCLLKGDVVVRNKKGELAPDRGEHSFPQVSWVWHDGVGYIFPEPQRVHLSNKVQSGSWRGINHQASASASPVEIDVFTLWLDHGTRPAMGQYEYMVVPGAAMAALEAYTKASPVKVLSNTPELQAVIHKATNRAQIVFYAPGKIDINDDLTISATSPCMVMVKADGKNIESLSVSDPTRKLQTLQLRTNALVEGTGDNWDAAWDRKEKVSVIDLVLPQEGEAGRTVLVSTSFQ